MNNQINGVIINTGSSTFSHCAFDVGVRSDGGSLAIEHSGSFTITAENTALDISYSNPGLYADYCTGNITNNSFDNFSSFNNCNDMLFENNVFKSLMISSESNNITFKRNLFLGNSNPNNWSRMFWLISDTNVTIINNTFSEFDMAAGASESQPNHIIGVPDNGTSVDIDIRNNIFWNISDTTNACVISNPYGSDITIEYNNIQGGADEVYGSHSWGLGNINEDPLFTDSENGDYTLQFGSPCIDAGDPESPLDSDGTRADMGAFEASSLSALHGDVVPIQFELNQNYPNPFNSGTTISFSLPEPTEVSLFIYNLLGQVVSKPIEKVPYESGSYDFKIADADMGSGLYFFQISAGSNQATKKMVFLK
jgi:hypothetical protein